MRSLSLKIFLWFWLALVMGLLASMAVAMLFPSKTAVVQAKDYFTYKLTHSGQVAIEVYEQEGPQALDVFLARLKTISSFQLYLFDAAGTPISKAENLPSGATDLALRSLQAPGLNLQDWYTRPLAAYRLESLGGQAYVVMLEMPMGLKQYLARVLDAHLLRFLAAMVAFALVCLLLTRYLTAPVRKLQSAVRKMAQGDLGVRVAPLLGRRKDEIIELGLDFDAMAARIESLVKSREKLLRDIAHELRSPLTRLNVALEITRKHSDAPMTGFLDRISFEADQLNHLITQILALSRLENTEVELHLEPVRLENLIDRIVRDANFEGQPRNCSVIFHFDQSITLTADGRLLHSAIENVVRNALRFTPSGDQVEITQTMKSFNGRNSAVVMISDQGPGVPGEALEDLFTPFFRVADKQGRTSGGAGVGLAIAFHAVSLHRGTIRAVNRSQGGLTVEIRLPIRDS
jgi:two-component system sensor histidine kinase CpxA